MVSEIPSRAFLTAAVWCVPFSGTVGLFNKLQTQKKTKNEQTPEHANLSRCNVVVTRRAVLRAGEALQLTVELIELLAARG